MTCATLTLAALLAARGPIPFEAEIDAALAETAAIYPVPKALVVAVISVESSSRPRAVSRAGAKGLMQLMPFTARRVGIAERELFDSRRNVIGGVRLLAVLLRHYEGDVIATLVAYNARPRRLYAPIPQNGETPSYVWKVLAAFREQMLCDGRGRLGLIAFHGRDQAQPGKAGRLVHRDRSRRGTTSPDAKSRPFAKAAPSRVALWYGLPREGRDDEPSRDSPDARRCWLRAHRWAAA